MRKSLTVVLICLLGLGSAWAKETIKIGVVAPMSGNMAFLGEGAREAIEMRLKELGDSGKYDYKVIYEDDQLTPSRTAMAVQKLKNVDHVDVLVSTWGYSDSVVLPLLKNSGILHFSAHRWKDVPQDFSFCAGDSIDTAVRALIALLNARGIKKVAWFSVAEQGEENYRLALVEALAKTDIKMVASLSAPAGVRDFRTWLMKLPASGAQTILDMGAIPQGEIIRRQARELQLGIPFISLSPAIKDAAPSLIEGSPLVYSAAATAEFAARYKAEYGKDEYYPVAQFYNAFDLIVRASEGLDGRKPTLKDLTTSLGQIKDFEGANGPLHFVPPTRFESPLSYFIFHNGVAVPTTLEELSKK